MKIDLNWRFCLALLAAIFVFGELHELAHLTVAYLVCGAPGHQTDFNLWTLCESCNTNPHAYVATLAGPVFSYVLMWTGFFLLRSKNSEKWQTGAVLVLSNIPFARIFTAAIGGGDETTVLRTLFVDQNVLLLKIIGFLIVFALAFPPLLMIWRRMTREHRFLRVFAVAALPLPIMMMYEFKLLGRVLQSGFLSEAHFLGVADFVYLHTVIMSVLMLVFCRTLLGTKLSGR